MEREVELVGSGVERAAAEVVESIAADVELVTVARDCTLVGELLNIVSETEGR